jgi:chemotaxis protein CheD
MFEGFEPVGPENYFLKPGYILVPHTPTVISTVLGSCVAVCLYDRKRKTGGMNHFQLPSISRLEEATARYGNVSTLALIGMMLEDGSKIKHLEAQLFGGAGNPGAATKNIGMENIRVARLILTRKHIPIVSEDVGGEKGRKVVYNTATSEVAVMKVGKIRQGDWYPYVDNR